MSVGSDVWRAAAGPATRPAATAVKQRRGAEDPDPTVYRRVQGLARGLAVLNALNHQRSGIATVSDLSKLTGLHRTTVKRLLETLRLDGYVAPLRDVRYYRLTQRVRELALGYGPEAAVCGVADPFLDDFTRRIRWPCTLSVLEGLRFVIRSSTHFLTPMSFHSGNVGQSFPFIPGAAGYAYLAFCPAEERRRLLEMVEERARRRGGRRWDAVVVGRAIEEAADKGYAVYSGEWGRERRFGAVAAPVLSDDQVVGCVSVVFALTALRPAKAGAEIGPALREVVASISSSAGL